MPVTDDYLSYCMERLECIGAVSSRRMFGGVMIAFDGLAFALIADDVLYFKVDDTNRPDFERAGMEGFKPFGKESYTMQYYEVPADVLEDDTLLSEWAMKAIDTARRSGVKKKKAKKGK